MRRAIICSILLLYIWFWVIKSVFHYPITHHLTFKLGGLSLLLVGGLFGYQYVLGRIGLERALIFNLLSGSTILLFAGYCGLLVGGIMLLIHKHVSKVVKLFFMGSLLLLGLGVGGIAGGVGTGLTLLLVSAFAEEYLKYTASTWLWTQTDQDNKRNLILFCILMGLGFSIVENILYVVFSALHHESVSLGNILVSRGLVSTLIHIVSTGLVGWLSFRISPLPQYRFFVASLGGLLGGFLLHAVYNSTLHYHLGIITVIVVIAAFFLLSYFLFQSDSWRKESK